MMMSGNIMGDNRAGTLRAQMEDAAHGHLQYAKALSPAQLARITDFEMRVYAAQQSSAKGGALDSMGARRAGQAAILAPRRAGQPGRAGVERICRVGEDQRGRRQNADARPACLPPIGGAWRAPSAKRPS
jgi:hypothetical protein